MPSWWGKFSSKEAKKKVTKESFIDTLHKKFKSPDGKSSTRSGILRRRSGDIGSERGCLSRVQSRSPSPSNKYVERCQSFSGKPQAQLLLQQGHCPGNVCRTNSSLSEKLKPSVEKASKTSLFRPLPRPACIRQRLEPDEMDAEPTVSSIFSESPMETNDPPDSKQFILLVNDSDSGPRTATCTMSNTPIADHFSIAPIVPTESRKVVKLSCNQSDSLPPPSRRRLLNGQLPNVSVPHRCPIFSAPDSSMSSPSRSPVRGARHEQVASSIINSGKHSDIPILGSGQCSSPASGQNSGQNSMGGDTYGQLCWQPSRGSPEYSPNPSPRMTSPGPSSRIQSGTVTPIHPRSGAHSDSVNNRTEDGKQQSHRLPLPPIAISNSSNFSHQNSGMSSPSVSSPVSRWIKGKLLGQGTFGHVYVGFNSETGQMCAMKEVTLFSDDAKSKESAKQLGHEIASLSRFSHPNIVQYYGSEMVGDKFYVYLEYLSGGSIHKILNDYGRLGESAIRSYTEQILSGLAYLHAKNTVHRDIKGANILVDPNGRVKLADFGMAKYIAGKYCPLSCKGSPYWMAPEVIRNSNGCSLAVDIWSLGCTVLEMATSKPPWSQYEGVAAMFKIGNSKELPTIPDYLSDEGKEFVRLCLQRNPMHRPTAAQLLDHPFVKGASPMEKPIMGFSSSDHSMLTNATKSVGFGNCKVQLQAESEKLVVHSSRITNSNFHSSDSYMLRNISCPVSPLGSPLLNSQSGRMSPSPISSPRNTSGSSTPPTGGIGAIPFRNQVALSQECVASLRCPTSPSYWDHDIRRGVPFRPNAFRELNSHESSGPRNQYGRNGTKEFRNGQSVLVDPLYLSKYSKNR